MNSYGELSDLEVNKLVAKSINPDCDIVGYEYGPGMFSYHIEFYGSDVVGVKELPDYCNNPADSWKLMVDNDMSLEKYTSANLYLASTAFRMKQAQHKNPGRAIAECFLMIKGGEV